MPKILVAYPGEGNVEAVVNKVDTLNDKSGPFDATILLGDVLEELLKESGLEVRHPIYLTSGTSSSSVEIGEIQRNVISLGAYGVHTFSNGIKMAFVSGNETILQEKLDDILLQFNGKDIDILLTTQWPKLISQEAKLFLGNSNIDTIVKTLKPKYHFAIGSNSGKFFERSPFQWEDGTITRFISLSKFGSKEKWVYAFNYSIENNIKAEPPKSLTSNPFLESTLNGLDSSDNKVLGQESRKRKAQDDAEGIQHGQGHQLQKLKMQSTNKAVLPGNCFFCLSNPKLQAHMIISIGAHSYLTVAKGPLTRPTDKMKFSGHCLIIPISHVPKLEQQETNETSKSITSEILRFEVALVKFFAQFNSGTVLFQINKSNSVHFHTQVFPIPEDFLPDFEKTLDKNVKLNNTKYERNVSFTFKKYSDDTDPEYVKFLNSNKDYLSFTVFHKSISDKAIYVSEITTLEKPLDLQFGRRVLAYLLQVPKRIKWDKCQQSEEEETQESDSFKEAFKEFDFTSDL